MDLFIPTGEQTKNWCCRIYVPRDLREHYGKAEFRKSTKTPDKVAAMDEAAGFIKEKAQEFIKKRAEIAANKLGPDAVRAVLDQNLIRHITSVRFTDLLAFDEEIRDGRGPDNDPKEMEAVPDRYLPSLSSIIARRKGAPGYDAYVDEVLKGAKWQGHEIARDDPLLDELVLAMATREKRAFEVKQGVLMLFHNLPFRGCWLSAASRLTRTMPHLASSEPLT